MFYVLNEGLYLLLTEKYIRDLFSKFIKSTRNCIIRLKA